MHTVAQTKAFQKQAQDAGLTEAEVEGVVTYMAENPSAGDEIRGSGGCRKVRFAGRGKGKSGGYRTITFFSGDKMPVFLLAIFSKGEKSDLSQGERNALAAFTKQVAAAYSTKIKEMRA